MLEPDTIDLIAESHARNLGSILGDVLSARYPAVESEDRVMMVPKEHVEQIAHAMTMVIAEALQSWIDAGSERDAVIECLGPHIEAEVRGWSNDAANDPANA